jgi:hypothetical protein
MMKIGKNRFLYIIYMRWPYRWGQQNGFRWII